MLSVPFALVGGCLADVVLGYNLSVAVAVGFIALAGVAAETGVVMLIYLTMPGQRAALPRRGRVPGPSDLYGRVMEGAVERVRPKMMTVTAIMAGLLPILWGSGTGSEVMSRMEREAGASAMSLCHLQRTAAAGLTTATLPR